MKSFRLTIASDYWLVLVDPGVSISTAEAYSWLTVSDKSNTIEGFRARAAPDCGTEQWTNDFEVPVFKRYPELAKIKDELIRSRRLSGCVVGQRFHDFRSISN